MKNQTGKQGLISRIGPVQTNRRSEASSQPTYNAKATASQKRLPKKKGGLQPSSYPPQASSSQNAIYRDSKHQNFSIATEQAGYDPGILYPQDGVHLDASRVAHTSQGYTHGNDFSHIHETVMQDGSFTDTNQQILYGHNIMTEQAIESELINQMSIYPETANILERSIEHSLTQTRMHPVLQFSESELEGMESEQNVEDHQNIEQHEEEHHYIDEGSNTTEFEDVTPSQEYQYQDATEEYQDYDEEYQQAQEDYVLDFTQEEAVAHQFDGQQQIYSSLDQQNQDGGQYYRTQNMDENLHLTYHYQIPEPQKLKKVKKKKALKQTIKVSGSNQNLLERLSALNQEKYLLLKQLNLQRQIDDNTINLAAHQSNRKALNSSGRCLQMTSRGTDRIPTSTKRKKSSAATKTKTLDKQMKEKYLTSLLSKSNILSKSNGKQTKKNISIKKTKVGGVLKENETQHTSQSQKRVVKKSKSYVLTKAGAIKKIEKQIYKPHLQEQLQSRNSENNTQMISNMRSSKRSYEISELTNRYNDYLNTQQSKRSSLVTSSRSLHRGRSESQSKRSSTFKNGRMATSTGRNQVYSPGQTLKTQYFSKEETVGTFNLEYSQNQAENEYQLEQLLNPVNNQLSTFQEKSQDFHQQSVHQVIQAQSQIVVPGLNELQEQERSYEDEELIEDEEPSGAITGRHVDLQQVQQSNITQQSSNSFCSPTFKNRQSTNQGSGQETPHIPQENNLSCAEEDLTEEPFMDESGTEHQFSRVQNISQALIDEESEGESINRDLENTFNQASKNQSFNIQIPFQNIESRVQRYESVVGSKEATEERQKEQTEEQYEEPKVSTPRKSSKFGQKQKGDKTNRGNSTSRESRGGVTSTARGSRETSKLQKFITDSQQRMSQRSRREGRSTGLKTERSRNIMYNHDIELSQEQIALGQANVQGLSAREFSAQQALLQQSSLQSLMAPLSDLSSSQMNQVTPVAPQCHRRGQSQSKNPSQSNHNQSRDSKFESRRESGCSELSDKGQEVQANDSFPSFTQSKPIDPKSSLMKFQTRQSKQFNNHIEKNKFNLQPAGRGNFLTSRVTNTRRSPSMVQTRGGQRPKSITDGSWNPFFRKQEPMENKNYASQLNFDIGLIKPSLKKIKPIRTTLQKQKKKSEALSAKRESQARSQERQDRSNSLILARKKSKQKKTKNPPEFNLNNVRNSLQSKQGCFGSPELEVEIKKSVKRSKVKIMAITNRLYRPKSLGAISPILENKRGSRSRSTTPCRSQAATERPGATHSQMKVVNIWRKAPKSAAARGSKRVFRNRTSRNQSILTSDRFQVLDSKRPSSCGSNFRAAQQRTVTSPNEYQDSESAASKFKARPFKNKSPFVAMKSTKKLTVPKGKSLMTRRLLQMSHDRKLSHIQNSYAISNVKSDANVSLERDYSQFSQSKCTYPSIPTERPTPGQKNINYNEAIAKVENIINSFTTTSQISQRHVVTTVINSAYQEQLTSPQEQRQGAMQRVSSFKLMGSSRGGYNINHMVSELPLSQESIVVESKVGIFEVSSPLADGEQDSLQRKVLSQQFDFGNDKQDKNLENNLEMTVPIEILDQEEIQYQEPSYENVQEEKKRFIRSHSNSYYRKDFQKCGLPITDEPLQETENTQTPITVTGGSTQEQTLDIKSFLLKNQVQIMQTGRSSFSSSNQNSVGTTRSQQLENQLLEELRNKTYNLQATTRTNSQQKLTETPTRSQSDLQVKSIFYSSVTKHEETGSASPIQKSVYVNETVNASPMHKSVFVDDGGPDDESGSAFGSGTASQAVNETVFYMPPSEDSEQKVGIVSDYRTHVTQSKLQARARTSSKCNLPR